MGIQIEYFPKDARGVEVRVHASAGTPPSEAVSALRDAKMVLDGVRTAKTLENHTPDVDVRKSVDKVHYRRGKDDSWRDAPLRNLSQRVAGPGYTAGVNSPYDSVQDPDEDLYVHLFKNKFYQGTQRQQVLGS